MPSAGRSARSRRIKHMMADMLVGDRPRALELLLRRGRLVDGRRCAAREPRPSRASRRPRRFAPVRARQHPGARRARRHVGGRLPPVLPPRAGAGRQPRLAALLEGAAGRTAAAPRRAPRCRCRLRDEPTPTCPKTRNFACAARDVDPAPTRRGTSWRRSRGMRFAGQPFAHEHEWLDARARAGSARSTTPAGPAWCGRSSTAAAA